MAAACAFERGLLGRAAAEVVALPGLGTGYRTPAHGLYHALNQLRITSPEAGAAAIAAAADDVLAGLGHRFVIVEDAGLGARVAPDLVRLGYAAEQHVLMALRRPRDRPSAPGLAREVGQAELEAVAAATTAEAPHGRDPAVVAALTAGRRLLHAAAPRTRFVVGAVDGQDAAHATLYADGRVAQVEDVVTREAFRGRGLARAVVSLACDLAAGHELVFLVADAADWPKELYARLGFDPVGREWTFTRLL
jgi:GNAT superfamily N-acetyltransferase